MIATAIKILLAATACLVIAFVALALAVRGGGGNALKEPAPTQIREAAPDEVAMREPATPARAVAKAALDLPEKAKQLADDFRFEWAELHRNAKWQQEWDGELHRLQKLHEDLASGAESDLQQQ